MIKALISKMLKSRLQISLINDDQILQNLLEQLLQQHGFESITKYQNPESYLISSDNADCVIVDQQNFMDSTQHLIDKLNKMMKVTPIIVLQNSRNFNLPDFDRRRIPILPVPVNFETGHNIHMLLKRQIKNKFKIGWQ